MREWSAAVLIMAFVLGPTHSLAFGTTQSPAPGPTQSLAPATTQSLSPSTTQSLAPATTQPLSPSTTQSLASGTTQSVAPGSTQPLAQPLPSKYSSDGLYNLGNAYARAGKPGLAVLNYERALLLAPEDGDIRANLAYVRASTQLPVEHRTGLQRIVLAVSPTLAAWLGVIGISLAGVGLLARRRLPRNRWAVAVSLLGVALIALTVLNAAMLWPRMRAAVVLVKQTPARVTPAPMGDPAFTLREAETVAITAEHDDFMLIRTRDGRAGWVARGDIGTVMPTAKVVSRAPTR